VPTSQPYAVGQQLAAKRQVALALMPGFGLTRLVDAEDRAEFALPPVDNGGAYRHAAYWTAVASRLLGSTSLAATASQYALWSTPYVATIASSSDAGRVLREAAAAVQAGIVQSGGSPAAGEAARIVSTLTAYSTPTAIAKSQAEDTGPLAEMRKFYLQMQGLSSTAGTVVAIAAVVVGGLAVGAAIWFAVRLMRGKRGRTS
jgi:hypothetical protein